MTTKLSRILDERGEGDWVVAVGAGLHPSTLSRYRHGTRPMLVRHAVRLAEYLGVSVDDIRGNLDEDLPAEL